MNIHKASIKYLNFAEFTKKLSPHSVKAYSRDLSVFVKTLGPRTPIEKINRNSIKTYVDVSFASGLSHATVKRRLACLKAFFKWLESETLIESSPFHKLDLKIRLPKTLPRNLSTIELTKVLKFASSGLGLTKNCEYSREEFKNVRKSNINDLTILVCIELLFTTGIRVGELTGILLSDIYIQERYIHIKGKGQRERRVFIIDRSIQNLISSYLHFRQITTPNHEQFLVNSVGRPATPQTVRLWLKKLSKNAKLSRVATPHMYRHSTATELLSSGVDIIYVQKLLGHESITTTQLYTHVNDDEVYRNVSKAKIRGLVL